MKIIETPPIRRWYEVIDMDLPLPDIKDDPRVMTKADFEKRRAQELTKPLP